MAAPYWVTDAGSLGTIQEQEFYNLQLVGRDPEEVSNNTGLTFSLLAGKLPGGIAMAATGLIDGIPTQRSKVKGIPYEVSENITSKFRVEGAGLQPRLTNLTSFSAYMDRLVTERIKQYNFTLENRLDEIRHQEMLSDFILNDIETLLKDARHFGYFYVGEKRTFDENEIIENLKVAK